MACPTCKSMVLFGGVKDGGQTYCKAKCFQQMQVLKMAQSLDPQQVMNFAAAIKNGPCPSCKQQNGPVEIHKTRHVFSMVFMTRYSTQSHVVCRPCGRQKQALALLGCLTLGWWGIPWGLLITPFYSIQNLFALFLGDGAGSPSAALTECARLTLAQQALKS